MAEPRGTCRPDFAGVRDAFAAQLDAGGPGGASVAVFVDGDPVVDLWGGWADAASRREWHRDSIVNTWSTTKTMTNLCALVLADRGELDLEAPVARYWPEFAAGGKDDVRVWQLLSHTSGLPGWDQRLEPADLADWDRSTSLLAAQAPWWEPGEASGYHALTQGYLVGEVVRRITGNTVGTFLREQVSGPLGADFHLGLPAGEDDRVVPLIPPAGGRPPLPDDGVVGRVLGNPRYDYTVTDNAWWRRCEIPAANGHGNARSVATVQSLLACGGAVGGVRVLSEAGCRPAFVERHSGRDLVVGQPVRFAAGWALVTPGGLTLDAGERSCFWGGAGGSVSLVDPDARMAFAYVMSAMRPAIVGDERAAALLAATYLGLGGGQPVDGRSREAIRGGGAR